MFGDSTPPEDDNDQARSTTGRAGRLPLLLGLVAVAGALVAVALGLRRRRATPGLEPPF